MMQWAIVNDPALPFSKLESAFPGDEETTCPGCGKPVRYSTESIANEIDQGVACSFECAKLFLPAPPPRKPKVVTPDKFTHCSECGGPAKGRGFSHEKGCPLVSPALTNRGPCPDCGGPAAKRGFSHTEDCPSKKAKKTSSPCPECGGPARGRGFSHNENCKAKVIKVKEPSRTCPDCGGPARGRGFTHKEGCGE